MNIGNLNIKVENSKITVRNSKNNLIIQTLLFGKNDFFFQNVTYSLPQLIFDFPILFFEFQRSIFSNFKLSNLNYKLLMNYIWRQNNPIYRTIHDR